MAVIGYARVSTEEQNLDLQRKNLKAAGCNKIFEDLGVSAIAERRPGFEAALAALQRDDIFIVWKIDRAFRSTKQAISTMEYFKARAISFRSLAEHIDTSTPFGEAMYQIQNVFSELERKLISERTKAGLEAARQRGKVLGRPRKLSEKRIEWARRVLQRKPEMPVSYVARKLRVAPRTLTNALMRKDPHDPS